MIDASDKLSLGLHSPSNSASAPTRAPAGTPGSIQVGLTIWKLPAQVVQTLQSRGGRFHQHGQDPIVNDGAVKLAFFSNPDGTAVYLRETAQPLYGADAHVLSCRKPRRSFAARQASYGGQFKFSRSACPVVLPATSRRARCGIRP